MNRGPVIVFIFKRTAQPNPIARWRDIDSGNGTPFAQRAINSRFDGRDDDVHSARISYGQRQVEHERCGYAQRRSSPVGSQHNLHELSAEYMEKGGIAQEIELTL